MFSVPRAILKAWYIALESWVDVLYAPAHILASITPSAGEHIATFIRLRKRISIQDTLERCHTLDITIIPYGSTDYPLLLEQIPDSPIVLYVQGEIPVLPPIAIIGTRKATAYGEHVTNTVCADLCGRGYPIVSGLAVGIDTATHHAVAKLSGRSIGVLPCGHNNAQHGKMGVLMRNILENGGAIMSEYQPGTPAKAHRFLERNRIIAGMAQLTIVAEAKALPSGSIHTANTAIGYHREVFAAPGSIFMETTKGCHYLIENGVPALWEINKLHEHTIYKPLQEVPVSIEETTPTPPLPETLSGIERRAILTLTQGPLPLRTIAEYLRRSAEETAALLIALELDGFVENKYGLWYSGSRYASAHR